MGLDQAFILCAGLGTRMLKTAEYIPKALMPLFEANLLDFQIEFLKRHGFKKIYVNVHHHYQKITQYLESRHPEVKVLHEVQLLGSGGAIHNLKQAGVTGKILSVNVDNFYFFDELTELLQRSDDESYLIALHTSQNYNRLMLDREGYLEEIVSPVSADASDITFSGVSIINLDKIKYIPGVSSFFETVVKPGKKSARVFIPKAGNEFWEFGTLEDYYQSCFLLWNKILHGQSRWFDFFQFTNIQQAKIDRVRRCYGETLGQSSLNFSSTSLGKRDHAIGIQLDHETNAELVLKEIHLLPLQS